MRRPWLVTTTAAGQSIAGVALTAVYLLVWFNNAGEAGGPDILVVAILGLLAVLVILACWGLWKSKAWGWWLAVLMNLLGLVTYLWDPVTRRVWPDKDELAFIVLFIVLVVLLLFPQVRRFFLRKKEKPPEVGASS
jgi:uncharacterized membrane protein (DUF2068 family)